MNVATDGNANDHRRKEVIVGAISDGGKLIANLHHGRPDIITKLNLNDGTKAPQGIPDGYTHDACFSQRSIEAATFAKLRSEPSGRCKHAALAMSNILTKNQDVIVVLKAFSQSSIDGIHHDSGISLMINGGIYFRLLRSYGPYMPGGFFFFG